MNSTTATTALLERLDRIVAELEALRGDVLRLSEDAPKEPGADAGDDFAPHNLLDTWAAAARFNYPQDTRKWCREGCGQRVGGRWMVSVLRVQRRLNGT